MKRIIPALLINLLICTFAFATLPYQISYELSYPELKTLSESEFISKELQNKADGLLETIEMRQPAKPLQQLAYNQELGRYYIRVAHWNIERGFNIDDILKILRDPEHYLSDDIDKKKFPFGSSDYQALAIEVHKLHSADLILINEADKGIIRTNFRHVVQEMANAIGAGYIYAAEFIELDPKLLDQLDTPEKQAMYKGLHGNAIISKFPLRHPQKIKIPEYMGYDWFHNERKKLTAVEKARRMSSKLIVQSEVISEIRYGSRMALVADLMLPNGQAITAVSAHLEDRTTPKDRERQMKHLLNNIKDTKEALVFGADMNCFDYDNSPSSIGKIVHDKVTDPNFIAKTAISTVNPAALATNVGGFVVGKVKKIKDPTARGIPILAPNKTRKLFTEIENFYFTDDTAFDSSNSAELSIGKRDKKWGNSNEVALKGFAETVRIKRKGLRAIGFKLDWLFVKPIEELGKKHFIAAFGSTLNKLNYSNSNGIPISDHSPITVDILI